MNNELYHYGMPGRSGRYPAGSGEHPKTGPRAMIRRMLDRKRPSEETIKKVVASGKAKDVKKYRKYMSDKDLDTAVNRLRRRNQLEKELNSISDKEVARGEKLIKTAIDLGTKYGPTIAKWAKEQEKEQKQRELNEIIRSGDAKKISKSVDKLSNEDIKSAVDRISLNRTLSDLKSAKGNKQIDKVLKEYRAKHQSQKKK